MNEKEAAQLIESIKDDFYADFYFDQDAAWKRFAQHAGLDPNAGNRRYTFRDYVETYLWMFTHTLLKPMAAAIVIFMFAIAGSIFVIGAADHTLPGEKLYSVKLAMEHAQLALAFSADQRARLRVEFAGRRLEEMVEVAATMDQNPEGDVQLAANRFKTEVKNIQQDLHSDDVTDQKEFAKSVGRKVDVYSSVTDASSDLSDEVRADVEEVLDETKDQVVEVMIAAHETDRDEDTAARLDDALAKEIASVEAEYGDASADAIATADALGKEGLYRRAFQVLKDFTFDAGLETEKQVDLNILE